jgi:tRNA dimethylallyltransferase
MFKQGLLDEARRLRAGELSLTAMKAIGYSEAGTVLDGVMTEAAAKEQMILRTRQYAKRQMTWFRHQLPTRWIEAAPDEPATHLADRLEKIWHG